MSEAESWYAGFDVVDFETTPASELPDDDGFHLICPIDGCENESEFDDLPAVADSDWSEMSRKDHILSDGTTLKEAYCPSHSLDGSGTGASEAVEAGFEEFVSELQEGLGTPLDAHDRPQKPDRLKSEYAMYDFAKGEITLDGSLLTCGHESCYRQEEVDVPEDAADEGWVSGRLVDFLSDGRMLLEGRCPEHRE
jgi:hypothetical protein